MLEVNANTVLRRLVLPNEGLLELCGGQAIVVAGTPERSAVMTRLKDLIEFRRQHSYRRHEFIAMMESLP